MYAHKKLLIAAVLISVFATFFSLTIYLTMVSKSSHAMTKEDLVKLNEQFKQKAADRVGERMDQDTNRYAVPSLSKITPTPVSSVEASLSASKNSLKAGGKDKITFTVSYKNNTSKKLTNAKLSLTVGSPESKKFDYAAIDLGTVKAGETKKTDVDVYLKNPGQVQVRGEIKGDQGKSSLTNAVNITAN